MSSIEAAVEALARAPVEALGFELVDVSFRKEGTIYVLTIYIDKDLGITMDDCVAVNDAVEPLLDEADPVPMSYTFSVSSPGLDRPIKTEHDFQRNFGKEVTIKLYKAVEKEKEFMGVLLSCSETTVTLMIGDKETEFERKDIAIIKPHISF